jgi:hypothetical protein
VTIEEEEEDEEEEEEEEAEEEEEEEGWEPGDRLDGCGAFHLHRDSIPRPFIV